MILSCPGILAHRHLQEVAARSNTGRGHVRPMPVPLLACKSFMHMRSLKRQPITARQCKPALLLSANSCIYIQLRCHMMSVALWMPGPLCQPRARSLPLSCSLSSYRQLNSFYNPRAGPSGLPVGGRAAKLKECMKNGNQAGAHSTDHQRPLKNPTRVATTTRKTSDKFFNSDKFSDKQDLPTEVEEHGLRLRGCMH